MSATCCYLTPDWISYHLIYYHLTPATLLLITYLLLYWYLTCDYHIYGNLALLSCIMYSDLLSCIMYSDLLS